MRIIHSLQELRESPGATVATIGNFDGVHLAHRQLLRRVVESARRMHAVAAAVTFDPHPIKILAPEHAPKLLTPPEQRTRLIEDLGIDLLVVLAFTKELAQLSPAEFVRRILVENLQTVSVHVGPNFRFGYRQSGNIDVLRELSSLEGFRLEVMPFLKVRGEQVSSTRIRELLSAGRVNLAGRLLGRPYSTFGPIVPGLGVGRQHTVPTLNLAPVEEHLPKNGVYVTRTRLGGTRYDSATNIGYKPTFGAHPLTVETYLLDLSGEVNEPEMEIEYLYRVRDEIKFQNPALLKIQIQKDARRTSKFFRLLKLFRQQARRVAPTVSNT